MICTGSAPAYLWFSRNLQGLRNEDVRSSLSRKRFRAFQLDPLYGLLKWRSGDVKSSSASFETRSRRRATIGFLKRGSTTSPACSDCTRHGVAPGGCFLSACTMPSARGNKCVILLPDCWMLVQQTDWIISARRNCTVQSVAPHGAFVCEYRTAQCISA